MRKLLAGLGCVITATAAAVALGSPAQADIRTCGNGSVLSGNQVVAPVTVTVPVHDNAVSVLGGLAEVH